jgi:hypothetical protein
VDYVRSGGVVASPESRLGIGESTVIIDYHDFRVEVDEIHLLFGTAVYVLLWEVIEELVCSKARSVQESY